MPTGRWVGRSIVHGAPHVPFRTPVVPPVPIVTHKKPGQEKVRNKTQTQTDLSGLEKSLRAVFGTS